MTKIVCPESSCRAENEVHASECTQCGTPLQSYRRLRNHAAHLFNQGLASARNGEFEQARDLFAAVVYWHPKDLEARNALAMACLALGNLIEAKRQWQLVLEQAPADSLAQRGLNQLETPFQQAPLPASPQLQPTSKTFHKKLFPLKKKKRS